VPRWAPDGSAVYFTIQERGSNHLVRLPISGGKPEYVVKDIGSVGSWSIAKDGSLAYSFASSQDAAELFLKGGSTARRKLTDMNAQLFAGKQIPKSSRSHSPATTTSLKSRPFSPSRLG